MRVYSLFYFMDLQTIPLQALRTWFVNFQNSPENFQKMLYSKWCFRISPHIAYNCFHFYWIQPNHVQDFFHVSTYLHSRTLKFCKNLLSQMRNIPDQNRKIKIHSIASTSPKILNQVSLNYKICHFQVISTKKSCRLKDFLLKGIFSVVLFWEVLIQEIELWRNLNYKWRILQKRSTVWTLISLEQWPISPFRHSSAPRYLYRTRGSTTFVTLMANLGYYQPKW